MIKPSLVIVLICLFAGCQPGSGIANKRQVSVLDGTVQVGLPAGYCINKSASRDSGDTAVMLLGRCSQSVQKQPALISIAIGQSGSGGAMTAGGAALAQFFRSSEGRATLSRSGNPNDVKVIEAAGNDQLLRLHLDDRSVGAYWRAITTVRGRLVTISTVGAAKYPLSSADGRKLLDQTALAMQQANRAAK